MRPSLPAFRDEMEKVGVSSVARFIRQASPDKLAKHWDGLWRMAGARPPYGMGSVPERLTNRPEMRERLIGAIRRRGAPTKKEQRALALRAEQGVPTGEAYARMSPEWRQAMKEMGRGETVTLESGLSSAHVPGILKYGPSSSGQGGRALWMAPKGAPRTAEYASRAARGGATPTKLTVDLPKSVASVSDDMAMNPGEFSVPRDLFMQWARNPKATPV